MLNRFIPEPRLVEIDHVDLGATPERVYEVARHFDAAQSPLARFLFGLRTLPDRLSGHSVEAPNLRFDDMGRDGGPGFRILADEPGRGFVIGAVGRFWEPEIPFADVAPEAFAAFAEPGMAKVAWALTFEPLGQESTRVVLELRLTATDEDAWKHVRRYFRLIGPFSHFMRRQLLGMLARELGTADAAEQTRELPGDAWLLDAQAQVTHGITIDAPPKAIWPWLVQMGCHRAGWYSYDRLDNGGVESAWEIRPELQRICVGDVLPATPNSEEGFEVLRIDEGCSLLLGGHYDLDEKKQLSFVSTRPRRFWQVTWSFVLEPRADGSTRLLVRARASFAPAYVRMRALVMAPVHHFMEMRQLHNLKMRAEGHAHDSWHDRGEGIVGALAMLFDLATPFLRPVRSHWGLDEAAVERAYPGDELVAEPSWSWTHGVEIDAPPEAVWPWVAQMGQGKGGFYSYQWLENVAGCDVQNADRIHPEWTAVQPGDELKLHPKGTLPVRAVAPGRWLVAHACFDARTGAAADSSANGDAAEVSWLLYLEPLAEGRSRFISRFRSRYRDTLANRLRYGPYLTESIGFVMDRRMLLGVKERIERTAKPSAADA